MVNNLPPPPPPHGMRMGNGRGTESSMFREFRKRGEFKPTIRQKWKAYLYIWGEEMKDTFLFRK
jgi:hypothetical protein